jgi:inorganic pyrophosphatase
MVGLIDEGQLVRKVLAIEVHEASELGINNIEDYKRLNPGAIEEVLEWLREYKVWGGKEVNEFCWGGRVLDY